MRCSDALSIHLLGDAATREAAREARRHIRACPRCSSALDSIDDPATEVDAGSALARVSAERSTPSTALRTALLALSALQLVLALPWLVALNPMGALGDCVDAAHLTRDGALGLLVAVAGVSVAVRPRYSVPALFITGAAVAAQVVAGAIDEGNGHVHAGFEVVHLLLFAIVVLIALCAGARTASVGEPTRRSPLRSVRDHEAG